nr:hypothetical protein [Amycolatopsis sulphurea]
MRRGEPGERDRGVFGGEQVQRAAGVEMPVGEESAAAADRTEKRRERGDVEQRPGRPGHVVLPGAETVLRALDRAAGHGFVGEQASLRAGRRARGVQHRADIAYADAAAHLFHHFAIRARGKLVELLAIETAWTIVTGEQDDRPQLRGRREPEPHGVGRVGESGESFLEGSDEVGVLILPGGGEDGDEIGVLRDVAQFGRLVPGIQRNDHRAQADDAEESFDVLDRVRGEQADAVAAPHTERIQAARDMAGAPFEFGEGVARAGQDQRGAVPVAPGRTGQKVGDGGHLGGEARFGPGLGRHERLLAVRRETVPGRVVARTTHGAHPYADCGKYGGKVRLWLLLRAVRRRSPGVDWRSAGAAHRPRAAPRIWPSAANCSK